MKKFILILLLLAFVVFWFPYYTSETLNNAVIISKEVKKTNGIDLYLLYVKDESWKWKTYKISDNIWHLQYSSSDLYLSVAEWDVITMKNYWFRIPLFSIYENIYDIKVQKSNNNKNNENKELDNEIKVISENNSNYIYFYKDNNIYKYNIKDKVVELYHQNILKTIDNTIN
jgi:membrane carboxypeptidase/penicillin-binding protein PbpC